MLTYMKSDHVQLIGYTDSDYTGYIDKQEVHFIQYFPDCKNMVDLVKRSLQLYCDNRAEEVYCKSDKSSTRLRYFDIKFLVIKDRFWNHIVTVNCVSTILNIADPLNKRLPPKVFLEHIAHMGMASHDDILIQQEWIILCNRHLSALYVYLLILIIKYKYFP